MTAYQHSQQPDGVSGDHKYNGIDDLRAVSGSAVANEPLARLSLRTCHGGKARVVLASVSVDFDTDEQAEEWMGRVNAEVRHRESKLSAALDGERVAHSRLLAAAETISRCESALSADAEQGRLRMSVVVKIQNDKEEALSEIRKILAHRAAEADGGVERDPYERYEDPVTGELRYRRAAEAKVSDATRIDRCAACNNLGATHDVGCPREMKGKPK